MSVNRLDHQHQL